MSLRTMPRGVRLRRYRRTLLGKAEIIAAMGLPLEERLIITPLLDPDQVGDTSVDLRLAFEFVVMKRANIPVVAPLDAEKARTESLKWQELLLVPRRGRLILHPGELILGTSLEYLNLPRNLAGYVTSRSSWGRMGLVIATALAVAPGYKGVVTLELTNVGNAPLELSPGVRIAQILLHRSEGPVEYKGRYQCSTGPELGKIHFDADLQFWRAS